MKKRFVTTLLALVAAIACLVGLVACGDGTADPVAGKTYVFEKVEITKVPSGLPKDEAEEMLEYTYGESTLSFREDGSFTWTLMGSPVSATYKQSGSKLTLTANGVNLTATVTEDGLKLTMSNNGLTAALTYQLVKEEGGDQDGDQDDNQDDNQGGQQGDALAGKTYKMTDYLMDGTSLFEQMSGQNGEMKIVFGQNGACTMTSGTNGSVSGTYSISENTVNITVQGEPQVFTVSGNTLTSSMTVQGSTLTMIFTLQA